MRKEADAVLAHLLDGNDMDSWPSAAENKHLGKGCRERKKVYDSESEVCFLAFLCVMCGGIMETSPTEQIAYRVDSSPIDHLTYRTVH